MKTLTTTAIGRSYVTLFPFAILLDTLKLSCAARSILLHHREMVPREEARVSVGCQELVVITCPT